MNKIGQLHEEAELGDADDQAVEVFAHTVLHEFDFLPLHQFAFGFVGAALGLAGFFGDVVKFVERNRAASGSRRLAMSSGDRVASTTAKAGQSGSGRCGAGARPRVGR